LGEGQTGRPGQIERDFIAPLIRMTLKICRIDLQVRKFLNLLLELPQNCTYGDLEENLLILKFMSKLYLEGL
jgi:hypothetical protein